MQIFRTYNLVLLLTTVTMISVAVFLVLNFGDQRKKFENQETYSSNNVKDTNLVDLDDHPSFLI